MARVSPKKKWNFFFEYILHFLRLAFERLNPWRTLIRLNPTPISLVRLPASSRFGNNQCFTCTSIRLPKAALVTRHLIFAVLHPKCGRSKDLFKRLARSRGPMRSRVHSPSSHLHMANLVFVLLACSTRTAFQPSRAWPNKYDAPISERVT